MEEVLMPEVLKIAAPVAAYLAVGYLGWNQAKKLAHELETAEQLQPVIRFAKRASDVFTAGFVVVAAPLYVAMGEILKWSTAPKPIVETPPAVQLDLVAQATESASGLLVQALTNSREMLTENALPVLGGLYAMGLISKFVFDPLLFGKSTPKSGREMLFDMTFGFPVRVIDGIKFIAYTSVLMAKSTAIIINGFERVK